MLNHGNMISALPRHNVALPVLSARRGSEQGSPIDTKSIQPCFYPRRTIVYEIFKAWQKKKRK